MPDVPLDADEYARWTDAAQRTLQAARVQADHGFHEWACFLAEQAGQLATKGLLHAVGAPAWGHDLAALAEQVGEQIGSPWPDDAPRRAARLSRFYIPTRYPDAVPGRTPGAHYGADDSAQALDDAQTLLAAVASTWEALHR